MPAELEKIAYKVATHANELTNNSYQIHELKAMGFIDPANEVGDSPGKFYLPGNIRENDAVLFLSQQEFPDFVARAVQNAHLANEALHDKCGEVIIVPILDGHYQGLSYAIWPEHRSFSSIRMIRFFQKTRLLPNIFRLLSCITEITKNQTLDSNAITSHVQKPLEHFADNLKLPEKFRFKASEAILQLESGDWSPFSVLQHSDFWIGNILLQKKHTTKQNNKTGFYVIDWGGALLDGAPCIDLLRFCISTGISKERAGREISRYLRVAQISPVELHYYLIVALGRIGMNLEQFPEDQYIEMCTRTMIYAETVYIK